MCKIFTEQKGGNVEKKTDLVYLLLSSSSTLHPYGASTKVPCPFFCVAYCFPSLLAVCWEAWECDDGILCSLVQSIVIFLPPFSHSEVPFVWGNKTLLCEFQTYFHPLNQESFLLWVLFQQHNLGTVLSGEREGPPEWCSVFFSSLFFSSLGNVCYQRIIITNKHLIAFSVLGVSLSFFIISI